MPWLQKRGNIWWIGYRAHGQQIQKSLATSDEAKARAELEKANALIAASKTKAALEPLFESLTGASRPKATLWAEMNAWTAEVKRTSSTRTFQKYESIKNRFLAAMNANERGPLISEITTQQVREYLAARMDHTTASTANGDRKILKVFFKRAVDGGLLKDNPAGPLKHFKAKTLKRKPFTPEQMRAIYKAAKTRFWHYMILGGFYTGLRMGDLITIRIEEIDFEGSILNRETRKKDKWVHIPLVPILLKAMREAAGNRTAGYLWPEETKTYLKCSAANFSNAFFAILADAGIVTARPAIHSARKKGRSAARQLSEYSFHSLRHTFITMLQKSGASKAITKELVGHSTDAINDIYTHTSPEELKKAVSQLPEFTK